MQTPLWGPDSEHHIVRRDWTQSERRIVLHGLIGRLSIAIEPLFCAVIFAALTIVPFLLPRHEAHAIGAPGRFTLGQVIAPIFGLATAAFFVYAIMVLIAPLRAFHQTFTPLFIIDGYIQYRHDESEARYTIAVLDHERKVLNEWNLAHHVEIETGTFPAMIEYSHYGGVHRIDGKLTGTLPGTFMPFGIGNYSYGSTNYRKEVR